MRAYTPSPVNIQPINVSPLHTQQGQGAPRGVLWCIRRPRRRDEGVRLP